MMRNDKLYTLYTIALSQVFCCYQQVYDIFNVMSRGDTPDEGPRWHVYTAEWCGCILTVLRISMASK